MASPGLQFPLAKSVLLSKPPYLALGCVCVCVCVRARARRDSENGCLVGGMTEGVGCLGVTVAVAVQRSPSFALYIPLSLCLPPLAERARERESERAPQELTLCHLSLSLPPSGTLRQA